MPLHSSSSPHGHVHFRESLNVYEYSINILALIHRSIKTEIIDFMGKKCEWITFRCNLFPHG